jgi:hypothetical protein
MDSIDSLIYFINIFKTKYKIAKKKNQKIRALLCEPEHKKEA